jgi:phage protein D
MPDTSSLISQVHIKIDGAYVSEEFMHSLLEVNVESSLHMADVATLVLHDPKLKWIDDSSLAPGKAIEIHTKATPEKSQAHPVFDGELVEVEPEFSQGTHHLTLRAFDRLHRLSRGRSVRSFQNVSDSDVVQKLAQEVGLQADVDPTKQIYPYLFQNNQTNLEFLHERAAALGFLLYVEGKKLCFKPPKQSEQPIELQWPGNLSEFRPRLTTLAQFNKVSTRGWDPQNKKEIVSDVEQGDGMREIGQQKQGGDIAKNAFSIEAADLVSHQPIRSQSVADSMAKAVANRHQERFIEAEGTCGGNPDVVAGASLKIKSVGDQFSGTYLVTTVSHIYSAQHGYSTHFSISGQTPATLLRLINGDQKKGKQTGLAIGIVTDNQDPQGWGRVKVKYPSLSSEHASDWTRVVAIGGGDQRGIEFLPEVNDEVLVGFEMGDIHYPYILGGLWNGVEAPPKTNSDITVGGKVTQRIIRSRTGHLVILDDSDGQSGITLQDKNGNKVIIDSNSNKLTIQVTGDISIQAGGQVEIKGATINLN